MKPTIRVSSLNWLLSCHGARKIVEIAKALGLDIDEETAITLSGSMIHARGAKRFVDAGAVGTPEFPPGAEKWAPDPFEIFIEDFWVNHVLTNTPADWAMEVESALTWETGSFILSGHIDHFAINSEATEAIISDLKAGYIPVDAAGCNWQLLGYAVLLLLVYPTLRKITLRIVQPRNNPDLGYDRVTEATLDILDDSHILFLKGEIERALIESLELCSGGQCRYCPGKLVCPCLIAIRDEMKLTLTKEQLEKLRETPNDELLGAWVRDGKTLGTVIEKAREQMKERLATAREITLADGTRIFLKSGLGQRKLTNISAALDRANRCLSPEGVATAVSLSLSTLEEVVAKELQLPKTSKKVMSAESWVNTHFGDLVVREKGESLQVA